MTEHIFLNFLMWIKSSLMFFRMYQMKNFQTLADLSKNHYSFCDITRNFDGLKATFSYLINGPFQQIKLQIYCILYIWAIINNTFNSQTIFPCFPSSQKGNCFCSSALSLNDNLASYYLSMLIFIRLKIREICHLSR